MKFILLMTVFVFGVVAGAAELVGTVANSRGETLLADSYSRVLYVFDPDQGTGSAKCAGDCAEIWPPYLLNAEEAKALVAPLGSVLRPNKKIQLTYNGRPVYTFAFDRTLGDDRGDGLGGVWHVVPAR